MSIVKPAAIILLASLLSACSGTYSSYVDTVKLFLTPASDATLTFGQLANSHDFLYVRNGDSARAALGLRFIEQGQLKWVSADNVMLATEQGRITRTLGLTNDLMYISNKQNDPLKTTANIERSHWLRATDWQSGEYGLVIKSRFSEAYNEELTFFGATLPVKKIVETLSMHDKPANWRFDGEWQNTFWIDTETGVVLKSVQQLAPGMTPIELVYISEIVRNLQRNGIVVAEGAI